MITYSELYDVWRKEKYNEKLQKLPKNFETEVETYFKEKNEASNKNTDSIFGEETQKAKKQLGNAASLLKEIVILREKKILNLSLVAAKTGITKKEIENMLDYEKEMFSIVNIQIENVEKKVSLLVQGKQKEELKNKAIRFTKETPEFMDPESKILGPFKQGDVANLPREIANILIETKKAIMIEG